MRPIQVEFQAFGPYSGYECVDFEDLSSKGLFLICGKTGKGKTMIIDAITFALFGMSSGHSRDSFKDMRCTRADEDTPTFVAFEFEQNGLRYRFERRLKGSSNNPTEERAVSIMDEEGIWRSALERTHKKDVLEKAEEIIGLTYEQFRQVIVLPQGQFEKLLTSDSGEKEQILTNLFGVDKWRRIAENFLAEATERKTRLESVRDGILVSLDEEDCESIEELREVIKTKKSQKKGLEEDRIKAGYEKRMEELREMLQTLKRFTELKSEVERRKTDEIEAAEDLKRKKEAAEAAKEALKDHKEREKDIDVVKEQIVLYESKKSFYSDVRDVENGLQTTKKRVASSEKAMEGAKESVEKRMETIAKTSEEYERLTGERKELFDRYTAGIAGELAKDLKEGEKCPVCGSETHPARAKISADSVSKKDLEEKDAQIDDKKRENDSNAEELEKDKAIFEDKRKEYESAVSDVKVIETRFSELTKNLIDGIDTVEDLDHEIDALNRKVDSYVKTREELESSEKKAAESCSQSVEKSKSATRERENAEKNLEDALAEVKDGELGDEEKIRSELKELTGSYDDMNKRLAVLENEITRLEDKAETIEEKGEGLDEMLRIAEADYVFGRKLRGDSSTGLQRYVLGIMFSSVIVEANRMLEMVHGGRYRLFRTDEKGKGKNRGLELKVHDRNSSEHEGRFVNTLSGGEKFLAALSLSIGMANVAMKSGIGINALFIDEGFGTLDEDSIGDAMSILSTIHEEKGTVGLISHMQILRDNIPTKLRVEEDSSGSHIVRDVG